MPLKTRVIPVLLLKNGLIVRSEEFRYHQVIGDPTTQLGRYSDWAADELIYLDISRDASYDTRRSDAKISTEGAGDPLSILEHIAAASRMPLTVGGGIRTIDDMHARFVRGADKVTINTAALERPQLITEAARAFGSQAIVVSIDHLREPDGSYTVRRQGREPTDIEPVAWALEAAKRGAGEIMLNSVDRDGTADGFDRELIARAVEAVPEIPIIALGGAGRWKHFVDAYDAGASAVAAANIFHFTELSYKRAKLHMAEHGVPVRIPAKWQIPTT